MVSYPEHLPTFDYIGVYRYFLTFCTHERRRHFTEEDHVVHTLEGRVARVHTKGRLKAASTFGPPKGGPYV